MLDDSDFSAVVFDLYDTLVIVAPEARLAHQRELARRMGLSFEEFERVWQESSLPSNIGTTGPTERRFEWVLGQTGARGDSAQSSLDRLSRELAEVEHRFLRDSVRVVDSVPDLLRSLRAAGIRTWLLSNCSPSAEHTLEASGLRSLLDGESLSCHVGFAKPEPGIYQHALAALNQPAEQVLYVADGMVSELTAARSLGIPAVRVTWSHTDGELPEDVPSVATPHDLLSLIATGRPRPTPSH